MEKWLDLAQQLSQLFNRPDFLKIPDDCDSNLVTSGSRSFSSNYSNKKSFRSVRKSKSSKDVLSEISSPKFRWKQNATIKEAAGEVPDAKKVEVKLKKEDREKNGEATEELERVATPDQVRALFSGF